MFRAEYTSHPDLGGGSLRQLQERRLAAGFQSVETWEVDKVLELISPFDSSVLGTIKLLGIEGDKARIETSEGDEIGEILVESGYRFVSNEFDLLHQHFRIREIANGQVIIEIYDRVFLES